MKNLVKAGAIFGLGVAVLFSCEKEELTEVENEAQVENTLIMDIDPVPGPDLLVTFVNTNLPFVSPSACGGAGPTQQPTCGSQYILTVEVTNIGTAPTGAPYHIEMKKTTGIPVTNVYSSPSSSLAPGAKDTYVIGPVSFGGCSAPPFSRQKLVVTADIFDEIAEIRETNNVARPYQYCGD